MERSVVGDGEGECLMTVSESECALVRRARWTSGLENGAANRGRLGNRTSVIYADASP